MNTRTERIEKDENQSMATASPQIERTGGDTFQLVDNRPEVAVQIGLQEMADNSPQARHAAQLKTMVGNHLSPPSQAIQKKENNTGLPDGLKTGMENLSGISLDDVTVHRNSDKPAQLQAHAYAQGTDIHLGPGQEKHLPHEAWHVVQQKQGRVKPTTQLKDIGINDDTGLEREADLMGGAALKMKSAINISPEPLQKQAGLPTSSDGIVQRTIIVRSNSEISANLTGLNKEIKKEEKSLAKIKGGDEGIAARIAELKSHRDAEVAIIFGPNEADYGKLLTYLKLSGHEMPRQAHQSGYLIGLISGAEVKGDFPNFAGLMAAVPKAFDPPPQVGPEHVIEPLGKGTCVLAVDTEQGINWLDRDPKNMLCICSDSAATNGMKSGTFGPYGKRVLYIPDFSMADVAAIQLAQEFRIPFCKDAAQVNGMASKFEKVIGQTPQARGDIHDVRPVLFMDKSACVVLCLEGKADTIKDAKVILDYYRGLERQVFITGDNGGEVKKAVGEKYLRASYPTTMLYYKTEEEGGDPKLVRADIKEATTGPIDETAKLYQADLERKGFEKGKPYVIINYRDSGHNVPEGREASHPELDTGEKGFFQLMELVGNLGYIPVPMGMPPVKGSGGTNLIEYWRLESCQANKKQNKRQAEYGLLRFLNENYNVRALAMRSGVTDAMVFAGIETISLDLAADVLSAEDSARAGLDKVQPGPKRSWRRATMRELIMPGLFHQGFLANVRSEEELAEGENFQGAFDERTMAEIEKTIRHFFGPASKEKEKGSVKGPMPGSPITIEDEFAARLSDVPESGEKESDRVKFLKDFKEMIARHKKEGSME